MRLAAEVLELRDRLEAAERRAAVAEAVAAERERIIAAQATALRLLEAGPSVQASPAPKGRPWWRR